MTITNGTIGNTDANTSGANGAMSKNNGARADAMVSWAGDTNGTMSKSDVTPAVPVVITRLKVPNGDNSSDKTVKSKPELKRQAANDTGNPQHR